MHRRAHFDGFDLGIGAECAVLFEARVDLSTMVGAGGEDALCAMVQAHFFVQGKGYFSQLAAEIRDYMGKPSWRTAAPNDLAPDD